MGNPLMNSQWLGFVAYSSWNVKMLFSIGTSEMAFEACRRRLLLIICEGDFTKDTSKSIHPCMCIYIYIQLERERKTYVRLSSAVYGRVIDI